MLTTVPQIPLEAEIYSRRLAEFTKAAWPYAQPGTPLLWNWHLDVICEHLEAVTAGQIRAIIINIPPRSLKSTLASVMWPAWTWTRRPNVKFLTGSYADDLSVRDAVYSRRIITSEWYQLRWGARSTWPERFAMMGDQNVKSRYENDKSGHRLATSVGGGVMGEGGDIVTVDDPHDTRGAESDAKRQATLEWWDLGMSTRLNNPKTGAFVVIGQRTHHDDLSGHLLRRGGYEHLCLPAEYEPKRRTVTVLGEYEKRTKPGELLHPERLGPTELARARLVLGPYGYAGQMQQDPSPPGGGIVKREWFRWYDPNDPPKAIKDADQVVHSWDLAFKDTEGSDYVVDLVIARKGAQFFLLDRLRDRMDAAATMKAIKAMASKWPKATAKLIEDKANGPAVISLLRMDVPGIIAVKADASTGGKVARLQAVAPMLEAGQVWLPKVSWAEELVEEVAAFPLGAHDDQVDALSQGLNYMLAAAYTAQPEVVEVERSLEEKRNERLWGEVKRLLKRDDDDMGPSSTGPVRYRLIP